MVLGVAFALRLAHVLSLRGDVLFEHPALDEDRYVEDARAFAAGRPLEQQPFWQPPGMLYFLGLALRLSDGLLLPRLVQILVGTATVGLLFLVGRRLFDARAGLAAAALLAVHGVAIFSTGELLAATWASALDLLAVLLLLDAAHDRRQAFFAGAALGVSAVFAATVLPFAVAAAAALALGKDKRPAGAFVAGLILPILPVTLRNASYGDDLVLVSTNGGLNFYLGNNERAFETLSIRPGIHWTELLDRPVREAGIVKRPAAASAWFRDQGLAFWKAHPGQALGLYLKKLWLFFHAAELPRDADVYEVRKGAPVLRALIGPRPVLLPDGWIVPAALVGVVASVRAWRGLLVPLGFVALQALVVAAFFVSARYRVPSLPLLCLFAVVGARALVAATPRGRVLGVAGALLLSVVTWWPARETRMSFAAEPDLYRGLALRKLGDAPGALAAFTRATAADPSDPRPWFEIGVSHRSLGRPLEAAAAWEQAGKHDPRDVRALRFAAAARLAAGDRRGALADHAANAAFGGAFDLLQCAAIHLDLGEADAALAAVKAAFARDPRYVRAQAPGFRAGLEAKADAAFWARFAAAVR